MIYVQLKGRCGNQMCEYAMARKLQAVLPEHHDICINTYACGVEGSRVNDLLQFCLSDSCKFISEPEYSIKKYGSNSQKLLNKGFGCLMKYPPIKNREMRKKREEKWQKIMGGGGIYKLHCGEMILSSKQHANYFLDGNFENPNLWGDMRAELKNDFEYKFSISKKNVDFYNKICSSESVCVTIRRGDFFSDKHIATRGICTQQYWEKAICKMQTLVPAATFFVFSDDIDWARKNLNFSGKCYFEQEGNTIGEKMQMMKTCKHFIISNSTFSWWAQYLGEEPNKIVVAPDRWFKNENTFVYPLVQDTWIRIETQME